jgi:hypothetical protein
MLKGGRQTSARNSLCTLNRDRAHPEERFTVLNAEIVMDIHLRRVRMSAKDLR